MSIHNILVCFCGEISGMFLWRNKEWEATASSAMAASTGHTRNAVGSSA